MKKLAVFVSGRGSNMQAIITACKNGILQGVAEVVFVFADREAKAIEIARQADIDTLTLEPREYENYQDWMRAVTVQCSLHHIDLVCCAGFMRKLVEPLLSEFSGRIINVHPALLPAYPGTHAVARALEAGEQKTGYTFHYITPGDPRGQDGQVVYDSGPIIHQVEVPIEPGDTVETLTARIQEQEHLFYPRIIRAHLRGDYTITPDRNVIRTRQR